MLRNLVPAFFLACLLMTWPLIAQQHTTSMAAVTSAIESKDYKRAETLLQQYAQQMAAQGKMDSMVHCVSLAGEIFTGLYGPAKSIEPLQKFVDDAKLRFNEKKFHSNLDIQIANHFSSIGNYRQAYRKYENALTLAQQSDIPDPLLVAQIQYNLGVSAHGLADVNLSGRHHQAALSIRESGKGTPPEDLYLSYNAMGAIMWYASKYDSAGLYFIKALDALAKMPETDINRYYRPSIIQNNLAGLYGAEGKVTKGIEMMKACITNTQKFIASPGTNPKKQNALSGLFEGMDNLAGLYRDIGDYTRAGDLLRYSYQQKQEKLPPGHPGVFISEILIGQHYNDLHEYEKAIQFLSGGVEKLRKADGDFIFWEADACYQLAIAYENLKIAGQARKYYTDSEKLYESSYQGEYDNMYLQFLRTAASFYAANNDYQKALAMSLKGLGYIKKVQGMESLAAFYQLLNLAGLSKTAKHYSETINYSNEGLQVLEKQLKLAANALDSVKVQTYQPKAILMKLQAQYALTLHRDSAFLRSVSTQLGEAMDILKRRRAFIDSEESINILVAENAELLQFYKEIEMELYRLTGSEEHLEKFVNLHESALYSRIRGRIDKANLVRFNGVPATVLDEEKKLRAAIPSALQGGTPTEAMMNEYLQATQKWNDYLERIRYQYPSYYNLRYGSPILTFSSLQYSLPANTSVVRYFYCGDSLYAMVFGQQMRKLVNLNNDGLPQKINTLLENNASEKIQGLLLKELYDRLWKTVQPYVKSENVIIIPDGILFALSFELLTEQQAKSFEELSANSLLSRHSISYNYSLYIVVNSLPVETNDNYIAFVPGFTEQAKKDYRHVVTDSIALDHQYLTLLSQPHIIKTAKNLSRLLGGKAYTDNSSTLHAFKKNAGGHKIVHIGTHAEFNNLIPERSRLIFSKDMSAGTDSNSLFLDQIYDCDIQSDLTILTACESGKPGFRDGEGMISIAHAFNYAGSNSILTGLWKIDEKASSFITEAFVHNLEDGMAAPLALKKAKTLYLSQAYGRTLAPAYWAGLVLIGQTPALKLETQNAYFPWLIPLLAISLAVLAFCFFKRRTKLKK